MTLDQLRVFVTVARLGHVTRAAQALNLTQSTVSAAIAALESRHGTQLFHRVGRGIQLTAEGDIFLDEARAVLDRAAAAERALTELSGLKRGQLVLWASQTIAAYWLPAHLHAFHARHPGIELHLHQGNTQDVAQAVAACSADLGFIEGDIDNPALVAETVGGDNMVLVAAADSPLAASDGPPSAKVLANLSWVVREPGSGTRQAMETALAGLGVPVRALKITLELPSNEAVCAAVAAGAGATVISLLAVEPLVALGRLRLIGPALTRRAFQVLRPGQRRQGRAERALLALIAEAEAAHN